MSQSRTLTVNQSEILARADEVESPIADPPSNVVVGACALDAATTAARQIMLSAENMRTYLAAGATERQRLAQFMRNVANAYDDVDQESATALNYGGQGCLLPAMLTANANPGPAALSDTEVASPPKPPIFLELKDARTMLDKPDQAASLKAFATAWNKYNLTLLESLGRFREFDDWEGDAAATIQAAFVQQRDWLRLMAQLSVTLAKQAFDLAQTHHWAISSHPTMEEIVTLQLEYANATAKRNTRLTEQCMKKYAAYQQKSEEVLAGYFNKAIVEPVNPPKPPPAPTGSDPQPHGGSGDIPWGGMPMTPPTPLTPMTPFTGAPGGNDMQAAADAARRAAKLAPDVGVKPASVGAGGGRGGGALAKPWAPGIDAKSVPAGAAGGTAGGSVPRGGLMGGGMPMGVPGQGQGNAKNKSAQQEEEALYTETRAWTEGLIGIGRPDENEEQ
ncbi:hypothetical protein A4G30_07095 [Mycobacterium kansasii]|uniref:PPE domain-containing protein n=1 Tax=Mycobacterium kansasii TaxID=1768 RepID=UPI0007B520A7|nr:hypothetical protein [Mycobacterium kansasii]KZS76783.1 hypothetical protein A4G30_07095 [Mycobacterium kansasii]